MTAFVQGPEAPIRDLELSFPSAIDPARDAVVDSAHRVFVNYEIFYFADETLKSTFLSDPVAHVGELTDPVSLARFRPTAASPRRSHAGRVYYFPDDASAHRFDASPERYAVPVYKMGEM